MAWSTVFLEASGHDHFHSDAPPHTNEHTHDGHEHAGDEQHEHPPEHEAADTPR